MTALLIEQPLVLVVEGDDDRNFFEALARCLGLGNVQVLPAGGKDNLRPRIGAIAKTSGFSNVRAFGVVRDADDNPAAAFQSVRSALIAAGLPAPRTSLDVAKGPPSVSVMILPGEGLPGAIEDLCLAAVTEDPAMPCVEAYFECLRAAVSTQPENLPKAKVQAYLASRPKPCPSLGVAALKEYWPWDADAFAAAKKFLESLAAHVGP